MSILMCSKQIMFKSTVAQSTIVYVGAHSLQLVPLLLSLFTVGDFSDKFGQIRTCPNLKFEKKDSEKKIHKYFLKIIKNIFINIKNNRLC